MNVQRHQVVRLLVAAASVWLAAATLAQTPVYRCGPQGREYSSTPCADGKQVPVDDARSAEQRRQAQAVHQRDTAMAKQLAAERREREAAKVATVPGRLSAAASAPAPAASKPKGKHTKRKAKHSDNPNLSAPARAASAPR